MRPKKTLRRSEIKQVYGNWDAVRVEHKLLDGPHIHEQYYYRFDGRSDGLFKWFPTTRTNLIKRGIIKEEI